MTAPFVDDGRRRHPSVRPLRTTSLRERVADAMFVRGLDHPGVAAHVLDLRGRSGLDQESFAHLHDVPADLIAAAEAGQVAADVLPWALRDGLPA